MAFELIREGTGQETRCTYLPDRDSKTRYRFIENCSPQTYARLLERGWRRFGKVFFRPICLGCAECRSLRVDVDGFRPNRSMRRNLKRNQDLEVRLQVATMTTEQLDLYDRYHDEMSHLKGWSTGATNPFDYHQSFVDGHQSFGHQLLYFHEERLLGVAFVDVLPEALSAVYCFYEPTERQRGLGVFSVLQHIALARSLGAPYLYLGYWIRENTSMRYKNRYRPHKLLAGRPSLDDVPRWVAGDDLPSD